MGLGAAGAAAGTAAAAGGLDAAGTAAAIGAAGAIGSSAIGAFGGGGGGGSGSTTQTQTTVPWSGEQSNLLTGLNSARRIYEGNTSGPGYYPGSTYAPINGYENQALGGISQTGLFGSPALSAAQGGLSQVSSQSLDPSSNPYLKQAEQNTLASVMPGLESQFAAGGRADSGDAAYSAANGAAAAIGGLNYGQYNTDATQQIQAGAVAPGLNTASLQGEQAAYGAGEAQQNNAQNTIDANMARYNYQQNQPYNALNLFEGETTGSGASGSTTTGSQPYYSNGLANVLSGATSSLGLYNALNNSGAFSPTQTVDSGSLNGDLGYIPQLSVPAYDGS